MAENGEISVSELVRYREKPYSIQKGIVTSEVHTVADIPLIVLGNNVYHTRNFVLIIDTFPVLWVTVRSDDHPITLNAIFRDEKLSPYLVIENNIIKKNIDNIPIRKVSNRYIIGNEKEPILEFYIRDGRLLCIRNLRLSGLYKSLVIEESDTLAHGAIFRNNSFIGENAIFGVEPPDIQGRFSNRLPKIDLLNAFGDKVGFLQRDFVFDLNGRMLVRVLEKRVQRLFLTTTGDLVFEEPLGYLNNQLIILMPPEQRYGLPLPPIPFGAFEFIDAPQTFQPVKGAICLSSYYCSTSMPRMLVEAKRFLVSD